MISDGSDVQIREGDVEEAACACCNGPTTLVTGHLEVGDLSAGWYTVAVTLSDKPHLPLATLYIGDWTEAAGPDERWGIRVGITRDGPVLQGWTEAQADTARPIFTPLTPEQVQGTPMEPQLWRLLDRILQDDSRL